MGGNILLGGKALKDNSLIEFGLNLTESCYRTCYNTATGLGPEIFAWIPTNGKESLFMSRKQRKMSRLAGFYSVNPGYYLRPGKHPANTKLNLDEYTRLDIIHKFHRGNRKLILCIQNNRKC